MSGKKQKIADPYETETDSEVIPDSEDEVIPDSEDEAEVPVCKPKTEDKAEVPALVCEPKTEDKAEVPALVCEPETADTPKKIPGAYPGQFNGGIRDQQEADNSCTFGWHLS
jgi:hypothetical protein